MNLANWILLVENSPKLNVWVATCQYRYIGPFFHKDQQGAIVNVDGARYLEMLENFFIPELFNFYTHHDLDPSQFWFMQDVARCHITRNPQVNVIDFQFGAQTIGEKLGEHRPARSPDLTPCEFFLWGYLKEEVYKQGPQPNLAVLETAKRGALQERLQISYSEPATALYRGGWKSYGRGDVVILNTPSEAT